MKPTNKIIQETKALIRLQLFLRYDCGLRRTDNLSSRELRQILISLEIKKKAQMIPK
ncbi:hypothetical protein ACFLZ3_00520 [Candidatus Omnitrophota bacterium]